MKLAEYIKSQINISDVIGRYTTLHKSGGSIMANCVAHEDSKASMSVRDAKGSARCFACGYKTDVIGLVMKIESLTFIEALQWLINEYSITVPEREKHNQIRIKIKQLEKTGQYDKAFEILKKEVTN